MYSACTCQLTNSYFIHLCILCAGILWITFHIYVTMKAIYVLKTSNFVCKFYWCVEVWANVHSRHRPVNIFSFGLRIYALGTLKHPKLVNLSVSGAKLLLPMICDCCYIASSGLWVCSLLGWVWVFQQIHRYTARLSHGVLSRWLAHMCDSLLSMCIFRVANHATHLCFNVYIMQWVYSTK